MEATTLITFLFNTKPLYRTIELFGSWDNFNLPYRMHHDRRRGNGIWSGCFQFENIIFDGGLTEGDDKQLAWSRPRTGGLKQGGTYWYYYRMNYEQDAYDDHQPFTNDCPLMPGQTVNILEVPIEQIRLPPRCRTAHPDITTSSKADRPEIQARAKSLDPASKFAKLDPPPFSKLYKNSKSDHALSGRLENVPALILEEERRVKSIRKVATRKAVPEASRQAPHCSAHSRSSEISFVNESSGSEQHNSSTDGEGSCSAPGSAPISLIYDESDDHIAILQNVLAEQERGLSSQAKHVLKPEYPYPNVLGASPLTSVDLLTASLFPCGGEIDEIEPVSPRTTHVAERAATSDTRRDSRHAEESVAPIVPATAALRLTIPSRESDAISLSRPKSSSRQDASLLISPPRPNTTFSAASTCCSTVGDSSPTQQQAHTYPNIYSQPNLSLHGAPTPIRPRLDQVGRAARHSYPGYAHQLLTPTTTAELLNGNVVGGRRGSAIDFSRHRRLHASHEYPSSHRDSAASSGMSLTPTFSASTINTDDGPITPMTDVIFNTTSTFARRSSSAIIDDEIDFDIDIINDTTVLDTTTFTALERPISPKQSVLIPVPHSLLSRASSASLGDRTISVITGDEESPRSPTAQEDSVVDTVHSTPSSYQTGLDDLLTSTPRYSLVDESPQIARSSVIQRIASFASTTAATTALAETVFTTSPLPGSYPASPLLPIETAEISVCDSTTTTSTASTSKPVHIASPKTKPVHIPSPTRMPPPPPRSPTRVAPPPPPSKDNTTIVRSYTHSGHADYTTMHPAFRPRSSQPSRPPPETLPPGPPASSPAPLPPAFHGLRLHRTMSASASAFEASKLTVAASGSVTKPLSGLLADFRSMSDSPRSTSRSVSRAPSRTPSRAAEKEMVSGAEKGMLQNMIVYGAEDDDSDDDEVEGVEGVADEHDHHHDEDDDDEDDDRSDYDGAYYELPHSSSHEMGTCSQTPGSAGEYTGKEFEGFSFVAADAAAFAPLMQPGGGNWDFAFETENNEDEEDLLIRELGYLGESIIC